MKLFNECRFSIKRIKGTGTMLTIVVDKETGVNYLSLTNGGITPLLNADGSIVITNDV